MKKCYNSINDANLNFILLNENYFNFRSNDDFDDIVMSNDREIKKK